MYTRKQIAVNVAVVCIAITFFAIALVGGIIALDWALSPINAPYHAALLGK